MARAVDERALALGGTSPQDEDEMVAARRERVDDGVGEDLPAPVLVRARAVRRDGQRRVQQEHAFARPGHQVGHFAELLGDVLQRRRRPHARRHVEGEPLRLAGLVVGVLAEDDDLHLVERRAVERLENPAGRRVDDAVGVGGLDERREFGEIRLVELLLQDGAPALFDLDLHGGIVPYFAAAFKSKRTF